ncbi:hypothetical protein DMB66_53060 [Actinoplanes sp. ATCC 53533]|uniref:hypothetical protein n=1 Tax=Actinoplanes sp. ATCC 53533 TaxID=1288362 RepID=UPI000F788984|nr:hypothetical protein [Actinoplanes sp. ATCC 53533]RSM43725.1 hypothetical protein DMB66_53060 [Actinoplanes sp. ATCC 53533]
MYAVLAWFSERRDPAGADAALRRWRTAVDPLIPDTYARRHLGGDDWGLEVLHTTETGAYRWPIFAEDGPVTAVSMGLPVGMDTTGGPIGLARRLLDGEEVHGNVVPPFTMLATEGGERFTIQQDWLGMGRLFTGTADGITVYCTRPSLVAEFLHGRREPDIDGWLAYTASGQFGGDMSPIRGVRLMSPGEHVTGHRHPDGGWRLTSRIRRSADDVVADGVAAQEHGPEAAVESAAESMLAVADGIFDLFDDEIMIGLSGGKDSRVIAAVFLAAGKPVTFETNADFAAEGETAQRLLKIVRESRGWQPKHRVFEAGTPADVLSEGLYERTTRLQSLYDFQFPSSYIERPATHRKLPVYRRASISGVGGELVVAYWYPPDESTDLDMALGRQTAINHLALTTPPAAMAPEALAREQERIGAIADRGASLGLRGQALGDYVYLVERDRRWFSPAYLHGIVSPFLAPAVVAASFALTAAEKRRWALHHGLLDRLVPEWSGVPFVKGAAPGQSKATVVWDGDGVETMCDLLDTTGGPLTGLIRPEAVRTALTHCVKGTYPAKRNAPALRQFTYLAVATHALLPDEVRDIPPTTYARLTAPPPKKKTPKPPPPPPSLVRRVGRRLRFIRRTALGRRVWSAVRERVR